MCKIIKAWLLCLIFVGNVLHASVIEHTIQRGETLESIAGHYNVSIDSIKSSNPQLAQLYYVGMVISIPQADTTHEAVSLPSALADSAYTNATDSVSLAETIGSIALGIAPVDEKDSQQPETESGIDIHRGDKGLYVKMGYDIETFKNNNTEFSYNSGMAFSFAIGGRYYFVDYLFADGAIGGMYTTSSLTMKNDLKQKYETTAWNLIVPLNLGGSLPLGDYLKLSVLTGPIFSMPLSNTTKVNKRKTENKVDKKIAINWSAGAELCWSIFAVGVDVYIPMQKSVAEQSNTYIVSLSMHF